MDYERITAPRKDAEQRLKTVLANKKTLAAEQLQDQYESMEQLKAVTARHEIAQKIHSQLTAAIAALESELTTIVSKTQEAVGRRDELEKILAAGPPRQLPSLPALRLDTATSLWRQRGETLVKNLQGALGSLDLVKQDLDQTAEEVAEVSTIDV